MMTESERAALLAATPRQLFIDGDFCDAADGRTFATLNPATGETLAEIASAGKADIDRAVNAARQAHEEERWRGITPAKRSRIMWRIGELIEEHAEKLAILESLDNGKPAASALNIDLPQAAQHFFYHAGWCTKLEGETMPVSWPRHLAYTLREPVGVVGQIIPWNYPMIMAARNIAPALAGGNCLVLKPSEETSLTALYLARLIAEAGVPDGVVNIVPGLGSEAGAAIAEHDGIDRIFFTGGHRTARAIITASAGNFKQLTMELGGKTPFIVYPDADLDVAVDAAVMGGFTNQGQNCCAVTRLYVHDAIREDFVARAVAKTETLKMGNGLEPGTTLGPLISKAHLERVSGFIAIAEAEGGRIMTGGRRPEGPGNFIAPAIIDNVADNATIAREEIFGPVIATFGFTGEGEVIARANASPYGLAASVWTQDLSRAHEVARRLNVGSVWTNCFSRFDAAAPWGGVKASGYGTGIGAHALDEYTRPKAVWVDTRTGEAAKQLG